MPLLNACAFYWLYLFFCLNWKNKFSRKYSQKSDFKVVIHIVQITVVKIKNNISNCVKTCKLYIMVRVHNLFFLIVFLIFLLNVHSAKFGDCRHMVLV